MSVPNGLVEIDRDAVQVGDRVQIGRSKLWWRIAEVTPAGQVLASQRGRSHWFLQSRIRTAAREPTVSTTARGFRIYADFTDSRGHHVRVIQSSAAGMDHAWIFTSEPDGTEVKHWKAGGGWEHLPKPGANDPPWREGDPLRVTSEGWSSVSPHLSPDDCRTLIAALQAHLDAIAEGRS